MEPQNQSSRVVSLRIVILIFAVGIAIGALASFFFFSSRSYQEGFNAAKALVKNSSIGDMLHVPDEVRTLSGTVTAVNGTRLTLHTQSMDPFADSALADRTVIVDASTKVTVLTQKDTKTLKSEMDAFVNTMKESIESATPPEPFTSTPATFSNIAVGDIITVTAILNVKTLKEFSVSRIQIQGSDVVTR